MGGWPVLHVSQYCLFRYRYQRICTEFSFNLEFFLRQAVQIHTPPIQQMAQISRNFIWCPKTLTMWIFYKHLCLQSSHLFELRLDVIANASWPALFIFIHMPWVAFLSIFMRVLRLPALRDGYLHSLHFLPRTFHICSHAMSWVAVLWFKDSYIACIYGLTILLRILL